MSNQPISVLLCDDSILARRQMKNMLSAITECTFSEASDGEKVVEEYKKQRADIVFLDIVMPKKDGIAAATEIMEFDKNAYIVMATSVGTKDMLKTAIEIGVKDFIQKPVEQTQLERIMRPVLEGRS